MQMHTEQSRDDLLFNDYARGWHVGVMVMALDLRLRGWDFDSQRSRF